mgnify:CR=1 FL=1
MTALVERVVWVSLATSLLLLPLLGLSGAIRRRYRAGSCYLLWLVLALRLLIPLPVPVPVGTALSQVVPAPAAEETLVSLPGISGPASVRGPQAGGAGGAAELTEALSWLWAAGAVLFLGVEGGGYLRARRKILEGSQARAGDQAALEALGGTVPVLRAGVDTPMTLGLLRPVIVLPPEVPEADLPLILRHELCHIRRRDLWYKGLMLLANAVHWFNPLVWRMAGQAGRDLELYCDEAVVEGQDSGFRRRYGQVLLQASSGGVTAALTTRLGGTEMKGRSMSLFLQKKKGTALVAAVVCAALLCGGAVAWGPSSAAGAQDLPQEAAARLQQVTESVTLNEEGSQVRFTLPELEEGEDWMVQISGRYVAADQVSMSVHLDTPGVWEPGRSYEIPIKPRLRQVEGEGYYTQLTLHISLVRGEDSWDGEADLLALASQPQGAGSGWLWPVEGYHTLSALFGGRVHPVTGQRTDHTGIDIPAPEGTPVLAAASGTVEAAGWDGEGGLGDRVILAHGGGWTTTYGQLSQITAVTGETVEQGEVIGYVGATGRATGPHLHLELAENGVPTDPAAAYPGLELSVTGR